MGSNGASVNWLPDRLIITSVPSEPQGTTATCAVTAKSNTRFPFDPREPWTLVAGPFHSRPVTSIQQSQAGPSLYLLMTQLLAIFFSDVVRVFRVIIIARFHSSSYRHNHQQKRGSGGSAKRFFCFFFVLNFYWNLIWKQFHRQKEDDKFNDRLQSISKILRWVCSFRKKKKKKKKNNNIIHSTKWKKQYLEGTLALARHDPTLLRLFFEFCSTNWKGGDREEKHKLIRKWWKPPAIRGGNEQSRHKIQFYWNG